MDSNIDTIREALKMGRDFFNGFNCTCDPEVGLTCEPCARGIEMHRALSALSAIDTEAIRREARSEALGDAVKAIGMMNQMAATAMNDDYLIGYGFGVRDCQIRLESILSAEPAQDDGKEEAKE